VSGYTPQVGDRVAVNRLEAADLLDAIDALPDEIGYDETYSGGFMLGYRFAMRQVKALLHPEAGGS
jgi:hypothetical protein